MQIFSCVFMVFATTILTAFKQRFDSIRDKQTHPGAIKKTR
jgi:hypothetical protein